jgi:23S rRNA (guanosine2251-2'-O)-methyltransferase
LSGRRVVYGLGPVGELVQTRASEIECIFLSEKRLTKSGDSVAKLAAEAKNRSLRWTAVGQLELDRLAKGGNHQGAVAISGEFVYREFYEMLEAADEPGLFVALDGVTDPHNLGAIVRSALLLGADGLIIPKDRAARVNAMVTKSSAGACEHLPIAQVTNLVRALEDLKQEGYWSAALASGPKAQPLHQLDCDMPLVLVMGSEGKGIRNLVARACDFFVEIPMAATAVGSFNVSVATAIALYEVSRQRAIKSRE